MATKIRNAPVSAAAFAAGINAIKAQIGPGALFHLDKSEVTVTAPDATDLPTSLVLCNQLIGVYTFHFADLLAHKAVEAAALPAQGAAVDLATAQTAANLMKTSHGTHIANAAANHNADATNTISAANASNQGTLNTLLIELKTDLNAHMASGAAGASIRL